MTASRCAWVGAGSHPNGKARPNSKASIGVSSAARTPPALNSSHNNGSGWRLITIHAPATSQTTNADTASHAA
jgi:hypothetical protein